MATASLVLGITGLVTVLCWGVGIIPGVLAIVFYFQAKKNIARDGSGGQGMATAGLVLGIITSAFGLLWILVWLVALAGSGTY